MLILDGTGINLRKFPRIKALDDDLWVALGDVVSENALLARILTLRDSLFIFYEPTLSTPTSNIPAN
jgi:hypothetical protein